MASLARFLVLAGAGLLALGAVLWLALRWRLPIGRLPGDIVYHGPRATIYFPWVTMLVLSVIATVVLNLVFRR